MLTNVREWNGSSRVSGGRGANVKKMKAWSARDSAPCPAIRIEVVPGERIELSWCCHRGILSPVRLPIPPSRRRGQSAELYPARQMERRPARIIRAMLLDDFNYELPQELIAQVPPAQRGASRLLHLDGKTGA